MELKAGRPSPVQKKKKIVMTSFVHLGTQKLMGLSTFFQLQIKIIIQIYDFLNENRNRLCPHQRTNFLLFQKIYSLIQVFKKIYPVIAIDLVSFKINFRIWIILIKFYLFILRNNLFLFYSTFVTVGNWFLELHFLMKHAKKNPTESICWSGPNLCTLCLSSSFKDVPFHPGPPRESFGSINSKQSNVRSAQATIPSFSAKVIVQVL